MRRALLLFVLAHSLGCGQSSRPAPSRRHVVFFGDSLTASVPHFNGEPDTYPYMAARQLGATYKVIAYVGQTTEYLQQHIGEFLFSEWRESADNVLVVWGGTNDCATGPVDCAARALSNVEYIARVGKLAGWRVFAVTMIARGNYFSDYNHREAFPAGRAAFNAGLLASRWFDGVADPAPRLADPGDAALFWDACHLQPAGYRIVADVAAQTIKNGF